MARFIINEPLSLINELQLVHNCEPVWHRRGGDVIWVQIIYRVLRPLCAGCVESDHERKQVFDWNFVKTWEYSYARLALTISWFWSLKLYALRHNIEFFPMGNFLFNYDLNFEIPFKVVFSDTYILSQFTFFGWTQRKMDLTYISFDIGYRSLAFFCHFMTDLTNQ